ncbi:mitofusin [Puccinia graminis f. sp. tritici]|uniref:Mitofusin n=1 Tax=Puccinia graminis f. sp. tritici TaxID=56615 RepID=A0A5B0LPA6_PUCGR|nr:mitofusin [Puccinia graminis f. sp. tritici]KAA1072690.1 mitofusin [Puccinia graminis f. sp. tritici]
MNTLLHQQKPSTTTTSAHQQPGESTTISHSHRGKTLSVSSITSESEAEKLRVLAETKNFLKDRDTLITVIEQSDQLIDRLNQFAQAHWSLVHPQLLNQQTNGIEQNSPQSTANALNILCLDNLSVPHRRTSGGGPGGFKDIDSSLLTNHQSLASSMLCSRLQSVQTHLADLRTRVLDRNSRILVTGDLNAGKSTFVNALLAREVAPTDQQPCTEVMCEILDKSHINSPLEQIHAVPHGSVYDIENPKTYVIFPIDKLQELVNVGNEDSEDSGEDENRSSPYQLLKVYISGPDTRKAQSEEGLNATNAVSLLRQGDVSVSFIDSPGLNRDTLSTMELFSKQSTIDVVVFVVSAENQFTLSAQEFLWAASQEKAYVFVVVNKWGGIRDKVKAERRIREQLRKLSPATWQERTELVHFVDSQDAILNTQSKATSGEQGITTEIEPFDHLQRSLSSFVFLRRSISKLQPAQTYTRNLLQDLQMVTATNMEAAKNFYEEAQAKLEKVLPRFNKLSANSHLVDETIGQIEENTVSLVYKNSRKILASALRNIREGKPAQHVPTQPNSPEPYFPVYDGLLSIFHYAEEVRKVLISSLEESVKLAENVARKSTSNAVEAIQENSVTKNLLEDDEQNERTAERKFNPQAMFSKTRKFPLTTSPTQRGPYGHCASTLGIATVADLVDFDRLNWFKSSSSSKSIEKYLNSSSGTATGLVGSLGLGTLTLFGTGVSSGRVFVDALVKLSELAGTKGFRKWTGTIVAVISVGFGVYLIMDIPRAIPRNIGKKLERELNEMIHSSSISSIQRGVRKGEVAGVSDEHPELREIRWMDYELDRMAKETRKVVRLTGFDLREKFRSCFEKISAQTSQAQVDLEHAMDVQAWLAQFEADLSSSLDTCLSVGSTDLRSPDHFLGSAPSTTS